MFNASSKRANIIASHQTHIAQDVAIFCLSGNALRRIRFSFMGSRNR
jgi:hypothetical protein